MCVCVNSVIFNSCSLEPLFSWQEPSGPLGRWSLSAKSCQSWGISGLTMLHKSPSPISGQLDLGGSGVKFKSEKQTQRHAACVCAQSCLSLCNPMDCSPPGRSVHGDSPSKNTGAVALSSPRGSSQPRNWTHVYCVSCTGGQVLYHWGFQKLLSVVSASNGNNGTNNLLQPNGARPPS